MTQDDELHARAKARLLDGELPGGAVIRVWRLRGSGAKCQVCDSPIQNPQVEHEVETEAGSGPRSGRFHEDCCAIWDFERTRMSGG